MLIIGPQPQNLDDCSNDYRPPICDPIMCFFLFLNIFPETLIILSSLNDSFVYRDKKKIIIKNS